MILKCSWQRQVYLQCMFSVDRDVRADWGWELIKKDKMQLMKRILCPVCFTNGLGLTALVFVGPEQRSEVR